MKLKIYISAIIASLVLIACESAFESGQNEKQLITKVETDTIIIRDTTIVTETERIEIVIVQIDTVRDTIYDTTYFDKDYPKLLDFEAGSAHLTENYKHQKFGIDRDFIYRKNQKREPNIVLSLDYALINEKDKKKYLDFQMSFLSFRNQSEDTIPMWLTLVEIDFDDMEIGKEYEIALENKNVFVVYNSIYESFDALNEINRGEDLFIKIEDMDDYYAVEINGEWEIENNQFELFPFFYLKNEWELNFDLTDQ